MIDKRFSMCCFLSLSRSFESRRA